MPHGRSLLAALCALALCAPASADILVGPFRFDDRAFADNATQLEPGNLVFAGGATSLAQALSGYSPTTGLINIGGTSMGSANANLFELGFTDLPAVNLAGPDLVFFDARFSVDPYEIAVRPLGSAFTNFLRFETAEFVDTGVAGPTSGTDSSVLFGLPIELDDFGLTAGTAVDAIRFRALERAQGGIEGDPVMAGALNVPEPSTAALLAVGLAAISGLRPASRRRLRAGRR